MHPLLPTSRSGLEPVYDLPERHITGLHDDMWSSLLPSHSMQHTQHCMQTCIELSKCKPRVFSCRCVQPDWALIQSGCGKLAHLPRYARHR